MSSGTCTHFQISTKFPCHCLYMVLGAVLFTNLKLIDYENIISV